MNKTYVIGDIHGMLGQLLSALEIVNFDNETDTLISLGDIVDRGINSYECVEELLKIKNLIAIRGNHDATWRDAIVKGDPIGNLLYAQGGRETFQSYCRNCHERDNGEVIIPASHIEFFLNTQRNYYIDKDHNLFVHGGFNRHEPIEGQSEQVFNWDRDLFQSALSYSAMKDNTHPFKIKDNFKTIFIGHTPTIYWNSPTPIKAANIWNLDTGCGKGPYKLTIMDLETEQYWQV